MLRPLRTIFLAVRRKAAAKIAIAVLAAMTVCVWFDTCLMDRRAAERRAEDLAARVQTTALAVQSFLTDRSRDEPLDAAAISAFLVELQSVSLAGRVAVVDESGRVLFSSKSGDLGSSLDPGGETPGSPVAGGWRRTVVPLQTGRPVPGLATPVSRLSSVVVDHAHAPRDGAGPAWLRAALLFVVVVVVLLVVWLVVQRPVSQLLRVAQQVQEGDLDVRFDVATQDELGRLAAGLSSMLTALRHRDRELQVLSDTHMAQMDRLASVGQLASGLAHEIKSPLHGVRSALEIIHERSGPETRRIIVEIQAQIARVVEIVSDLLSYARARSAQFELCRVEHVLGRALALLRPDIQRRGIRLTKEVASDLPETFVDREKIQQVLLNLLLNSLQAVSDGGCLSTSVTWSKESNLITIRVEDDGPGVSEELAERIFEPFFTTKEEGHGLGLATARMLVEQNNGAIRLRRSGPGAAFEVLLPVISGDDLIPARAETPAAEGEPAGAAREAYLFSLACRCPLGSDGRCPVEGLRRIRALDLEERLDAIRSLSEEERTRIQRWHAQCAFLLREDVLRRTGGKRGTPPVSPP